MAQPARPEEKEIEDWNSHLGEQWERTAHPKFQKMDEFYHRTYGIWPAGIARETYRPSTPTRLVDHAADTQFAFDPTVRRQPLGEGDDAKRSADNIEKALRAIMLDAALHEPNLPWKQVGRYHLTYGYAIIEGPLTTFIGKPVKPRQTDDETDEEFQERQIDYEALLKGFNPIRIRAPHPSSVLLPPLEKQPTVAVKRSQRYAYELESLIVVKKGQRKDTNPLPKNQDRFEQLKVLEFWTPHWHVMKLQDGQILFAEKHKLGFVPYVHSYSGFGQERTDQETFDPADLCVGILEAVTDSIKVEAQSMSAKHSALIRAATTPVGTTGDAAQAQQEIARGGILEGRKEDYWIMDQPNWERWMLEVDKEVSRDIEAGTYSPALLGLRQEGVSTVGQQVILSTAASRKFAAPNRQAEHMGTITASRVLQIVERMREPITVQGHTLRPSDIRRNYAVQVSFPVIDKNLQLQERELALRELAAGAIDKTTYQEESGREDITQLRERSIDDRVRETQQYSFIAAQAAATRLGLDEQNAQDVAKEVADLKPGQPLPGEANGTGGLAGLVGVNGQPLAPQEPGTPGGAQQAGRELRQPLAADAVRPKRVDLG